MATIVQSKSGGADGANRAATAALDRATTAGLLLLSFVAVDKNAGGVPGVSTGWTPGDGQTRPSITLAAATRAPSDATSTDQCGWTWPTNMAVSWWIAETDFDATATIRSSPTWSDDTAVASVDLGTIVAAGNGLAIAAVAVDTLSNWLSGGRAATWTNGFTEIAAPTTPLNDTGMSIATATVTNGQSISTRATSASGGRDQASGILVVVTTAAAAATPRRGLLLGVG